MIYMYTVVVILMIGWSQIRTVNCLSIYRVISYQMRSQRGKSNVAMTSTDGTLLESANDINVDFRVPASFLKSNEKLQQQLQNIDITQLKVDDPFFLLLPWPSDGGPQAKAYGRHFTWKRSLSDAERMFAMIIFSIFFFTFFEFYCFYHCNLYRSQMGEVGHASTHLIQRRSFSISTGRLY